MTKFQVQDKPYLKTCPTKKLFDFFKFCENNSFSFNIEYYESTNTWEITAHGIGMEEAFKSGDKNPTLSDAIDYVLKDVEEYRKILELKDCPFCGGKVTGTKPFSSGGNNIPVIICNKCNYSFSGNTDEDLASLSETWNRRSANDNP